MNEPIESLKNMTDREHLKHPGMSNEEHAKILDANLHDRVLLNVGTSEDGYIVLNFGEYALFLQSKVRFLLVPKSGVRRMPA